MSEGKEHDFTAERYRGILLIYPNTDEAQAWADEHGPDAELSGGIEADAALVDSLRDLGLTIEGEDDE